MSSPALLTEYSRVLITTLADAGVRDAIISPGSRSTPLVLAALSCERLRTEWILDERSAAYNAVARAKIDHRPCALICTSGTAAANYYPAVVEASLSSTPLIVLTADRPQELSQCGAPQTIDQVKLYGSFVRYFADLGMPEASPDAFFGLRRTVAQAVGMASNAPAGPVHLDFRARKPLEPPPRRSEADRELAALADRVLAHPIPRAEAPARTATESTLTELGDRLQNAERPLMLLGPLVAAGAVTELRDALVALSARTPLALYAETTSQVRLSWPDGAPEGAMVDGLGILLSSGAFGRHFVPDLVIQVGAPPVASSVDAFVRAHPEIPRSIIAEDGWPDPASTASSLVVGAPPSRVVAALADRVAARSMSGEPSPWRRWLAGCNERVWRAVDQVSRAAPSGEASAVRAAVDALAHGDLLALGNSLPVREVDTYCRARDRGVAVFHQRGTSGIEGALAGIAGAAKRSERPTTALIGDLTFLHDLGGLGALASVPVPVAVVVLNNRGGRIFEQLPVATALSSEPDKLEYWTTPHRLRLTRAAELFEIESTVVRSAADLTSALGCARKHDKATVIEVEIAPEAALDDRAGLLRALNIAMADLQGPAT